MLTTPVGGDHFLNCKTSNILLTIYSKTKWFQEMSWRVLLQYAFCKSYNRLVNMIEMMSCSASVQKVTSFET